MSAQAPPDRWTLRPPSPEQVTRATLPVRPEPASQDGGHAGALE